MSAKGLSTQQPCQHRVLCLQLQAAMLDCAIVVRPHAYGCSKPDHLKHGRTTRRAKHAAPKAVSAGRLYPRRHLFQRQS